MESKALFEDVKPLAEGKRRKKASAPVFKEYNQSQRMLLPPSLEEMIPGKHLVRVVNRTIDQMNIEPLIETYKGGGTSSYHPRMMIKVLVYARSEERRVGKECRSRWS